MKERGSGIGDAARRTAYAAGQMARIAWYTGHYVVGRRRMGPIAAPGEAPPKDVSAPLDRRRLGEAFRELFRRDWRNIEAGLYRFPPGIVRPPSLAALIRSSRDYLEDAGRVARRRFSRGHSEVRSDELKPHYPRYYLQNFHFQSDGWLSAASAERYDMQVETLFTGAAAVMRRQALPEIRKVIDGRDPGTLRLLDLGCGTGAFFEEVLHNWPQIDATALDLSPAYLGKARARLGGSGKIRFVEANAEATGLPAGHFDIVTAVYLFHELPPAVRRIVSAEIARLLKPGGVLIEVDTIQFGDEPGIDVLLENFPRAFHEPYYDSYCRENLDALFGDVGLFPSAAPTLAFLTKVRSFRKPATATS
jgi:ubiquinone/menaquinone biosynthesis C-methylase UbiE